MDWFWATLAILCLGMVFIIMLLSIIQLSQVYRLIDLNVVKEYYNWMHAHPGFRSLNRVRAVDPNDDRAMVYTWTIAYVKDGKHQETENAFSPKMAIRMFREVIK